MIVHHRAGEFVSGAMSRQYRTAFNAAAGVTAAAGSPLLWWLVWGPLDWIWPTAVLSLAYSVNLRARAARIRPYELKPPTKHTEDEVLELQDIYFHMPKEHRSSLEPLLEAAYAQIERGNVDAVIPRLERARAFKTSVISYNAKSDDQADLKQIEAASRAMHRALMPAPAPEEAAAAASVTPITGEVQDRNSKNTRRFA